MFWARNGQEAVEIARAKNVNLVLMDIRMPEVDGFEACKRIRAFNKHVVIFAVTAHAYKIHRDEAEIAGCDDT